MKFKRINPYTNVYSFRFICKFVVNVAFITIDQSCYLNIWSLYQFQMQAGILYNNITPMKSKHSYHFEGCYMNLYYQLT